MRTDKTVFQIPAEIWINIFEFRCICCIFRFDAVNSDIEELVDLAKTYDDMEIVRKMKKIVPEYKSNNSKYEVLDAEA